jgi:O-antigen ligase
MRINEKIFAVVPVFLALAIWSTMFFLKLNNVVLGIFAAYCLFIGWLFPRKMSSKADALVLLPLLLFFTYLIGYYFGSDPKESLDQLDKRFGLLGYPVLFFFLSGNLQRQAITRMLYAFVLVCLTISLVCYANAIWNIIQAGAIQVEGKERNYYYFSYLQLTSIVRIDPIYLSLYINFSIVILLFKPLKKRIISFVLVVYLILFNLLVASKAGIIGLIIVLVIYILSLIRNRYLAVGGTILIVTTFVVLLFSSKFLKERFIVSTEFEYDRPWAGDWNSTSQRLAIWTCAVETIKDVFPWGYGTADGQKALNKTYVKKKYIRGYEDDYNAHSEYLHTMLDTGVLGLLVLLIILCWPLFRSLNLGNQLFTSFLVLMIFYFVVEVVLARRDGITFFLFFYCLLAINPSDAVVKPKPNIPG